MAELLYNVTITYFWPHCQICLECAYGVPITVLLENNKSSNLNGPMALCSINCKKNDGIKCPKFEKEKEDLKLDS